MKGFQFQCGKVIRHHQRSAYSFKGVSHHSVIQIVYRFHYSRINELNNIMSIFISKTENIIPSKFWILNDFFFALLHYTSKGAKKLVYCPSLLVLCIIVYCYCLNNGFYVSLTFYGLQFPYVIFSTSCRKFMFLSLHPLCRFTSSTYSIFNINK